MRAQFITAEEVQQVLDVSRSKSYQIIRGFLGVFFSFRPRFDPTLST